MRPVPSGCTQTEIELFRKIQELSKKELKRDDEDILSGTRLKKANKNNPEIILSSKSSNKKLIQSQISPQTDVKAKTLLPRLPEFLTFGKYLIETWYSAPYPQEYVQKKVLKLHIQKKCHVYFCVVKILVESGVKREIVKNNSRHVLKAEGVLNTNTVFVSGAAMCSPLCSPGNEIYCISRLRVFEDEENINRTNCQNLWLLVKLFLDQKTLYLDVEPFLFSILTQNDAKCCNMEKDLSKETGMIFQD